MRFDNAYYIELKTKHQIRQNLGDEKSPRFYLIWSSVNSCYFSACAGLVASIMCTPADVIKTRVMNQPTENGRYSSHLLLP